MPRDPYKYFRLEGRELLDQFDQGILELEKSGEDAVMLQRLLRLAHTLKGAARIVKQQEIANHAHAIEDVLSPHRESRRPVTRSEIDSVLGHLDEIAERLQALEEPDSEEAPARAKAGAQEGARLVRADLREIDDVLDCALEAHALLNGVRASAKTLEHSQRLADALGVELGAVARTASPSRRLASSDRAIETIGELRRRLARLEQSLASALDQMDRGLRQLRDGAEQLRLVPAAALFSTLERTVRDTARTLSKDVELTATGGEIRLDSYILETIQGALTQIVRNAVVHGIEPAAERLALGKPSAGRVRIEVFRRARRVVFKCRDDGRGFDFAAVRSIAERRGVSGATAGDLDAESLVRLLLRGGISTAKTVTEMSGRGVGLDVVRAALERLGGEISVDSEPQRGATFELDVPPSLLATDALAVVAGGAAAAIPLDAVRAVIKVGGAEIGASACGMTVLFEQSAIPFVPLARIVGGERRTANRDWTAAVVAGPQGMAAFGVDRLHGVSRLVVRPLPDHACFDPTVAGVFLDAEGNPQPFMDAEGLLARAAECDGAVVEPPSRKLKVLVVDDSLTTRMLERSILESAGYDVEVAASGEEALDVVRSRRCGLVLVDVEMPGMDGFGFIERLRADPAIHDIPAILVTSRNAAEDRTRGREAGAQGYIVKSEFNQVELLGMIRSLMG